MIQMVFEPTIPGFERAKTVHALDREAKPAVLEDQGFLPLDRLPAMAKF
jgi:hypothetical protein